MRATSKKTNTVGIKELKNKTSEIVQRVVRTKRPVTIRKNNRSIAQIIPLQEDMDQTLLDMDLLASKPAADWKTLRLHSVESVADLAIQAISKDRDEK